MYALKARRRFCCFTHPLVQHWWRDPTAARQAEHRPRRHRKRSFRHCVQPERGAVAVAVVPDALARSGSVDGARVRHGPEWALAPGHGCEHDIPLGAVDHEDAGGGRRSLRKTVQPAGRTTRGGPDEFGPATAPSRLRPHDAGRAIPHGGPARPVFRGGRTERRRLAGAHRVPGHLREPVADAALAPAGDAAAHRDVRLRRLALPAPPDRPPPPPPPPGSRPRARAGDRRVHHLPVLPGDRRSTGPSGGQSATVGPAGAHAAAPAPARRAPPARGDGRLVGAHHPHVGRRRAPHRRRGRPAPARPGTAARGAASSSRPPRHLPRRPARHRRAPYPPGAAGGPRPSCRPQSPRPDHPHVERLRGHHTHRSRPGRRRRRLSPPRSHPPGVVQHEQRREGQRCQRARRVTVPRDARGGSLPTPRGAGQHPAGPTTWRRWPISWAVSATPRIDSPWSPC